MSTNSSKKYKEEKKLSFFFFQIQFRDFFFALKYSMLLEEKRISLITNDDSYVIV